MTEIVSAVPGQFATKPLDSGFRRNDEISAIWENRKTLIGKMYDLDVARATTGVSAIEPPVG